MFSSDSTPPAYKWDADINKSQIAIYKEFPRQVVKYPAIVIQASAASDRISSINGEEQTSLFDDQGNLTGIQVGGPVTMPVRILIMAMTQDDRERITDLVGFFVRFLSRNVFAEFEIAYIDIRTEGEEQEVAESGDIIFSNTVVVDCYTEYNDFFDLSVLQAIESIEVNIQDQDSGSELLKTGV